VRLNIPEEKYENYFRRNSLVLPFVSFLVLLSLYFGEILCIKGFNSGHYWTIFPAAIFAHSFFIICIHDGAHRAITRSKWDDLFMNVFAGCMLLPFFPEPFKRYHMIHHGNTNTANDPLWSKVKNNLFTKHRFFYVLCQFIPMLFTLYVLLSSEGDRKKNNIRGPKIRYHYMAISFLFSGIVLYFFKIPLFFYLGTIFLLGVIGAIRHWCEHMGINEKKESNTFWFPLGMGVGNHAIHHMSPSLSWLSLALGLRKREYETNPFKTVWQMTFNRKFTHYTSGQDKE